MWTARINGELFFDANSADPQYMLTGGSVDKAAGATGQAKLSIPDSNVAYNNLHKLVDYVDIYRDGILYFSGRIITIRQDFNTVKTITCEGILAILNDSIFEPITHDGTLYQLLDRIVENHNQQVQGKQVQIGHISISDGACYRAYQNFETSLSRLFDLQKSFGGYVDMRCVNGIYYLDWFTEYDRTTTQKIEFGKNLLDLVQEEESNNIATMLIPLGARQDDGLRVRIPSPQVFVYADQQHIDKYGYICATMIWDDVNDPDILLSKAQAAVNKLCEPKKSMKVQAIDLYDAGYDVSAFEIGQKVQCISEPHDAYSGISETNAIVGKAIVGKAVVGRVYDYYEFNVNKLHVDLFAPEASILQLGEYQNGFIDSSAKSGALTLDKTLENMSSEFQRTIVSITAAISGNKGGYVIIHDSDGDGYPDEILIMDTPSINTAQNVWRWNQAGLGHSSTGYQGNFTTAMTADGKIVADFIQAGTMLFDRCRGGTLSLGGVNNSSGELIVYNERGTEIGRWDKDGAEITGDLTLKKNNIITQIGEFEKVYVSSDGTIGRSTKNGLVMHRDTTYSSDYQYAIIREDNAAGYIAGTYRYIKRDMQTVGGAGSFDDDSVVVKFGSETYEYSFQHTSYRAVRVYSSALSGYSGGMYFGLRDGKVFFQIKQANQFTSPQSRENISGVLAAYQDVLYTNSKQIAVVSTSSRRYKQDIKPIEDNRLDPHRLLNLRVVQFVYRDGEVLQYDDMKGKTLPGFIAEEVDEIYPSATIHNKDREVESWDERRIIPGMLALIQEQQKAIKDLEARVAALEKGV